MNNLKLIKSTLLSYQPFLLLRFGASRLAEWPLKFRTIFGSDDAAIENNQNPFIFWSAYKPAESLSEP